MKFIAFIAVLALCACTPAPIPAAPSAARENGWSALSLTVTTAALERDKGVGARYGDLIFRGGVALRSDNPLFGGWSGIEVDERGQFLAVSDEGSFLAGALALDEFGALVGVTGAEIGLMRGEDGSPLDHKDWKDAEDIVRMADGRYAVSFEHHHRVLFYDLDKNGPLGAAEAGPSVPQDMAPNEGLEALAQAGDGDLIAGREFTADYKSPTQIYKLKQGAAPVAGTAQVTDDFALVALRRLPNGDYLALERFYFPLVGNRTVLRRYAGAGLDAAPPSLYGPAIAAFAKPQNIDNFEGLAVTPRAGALRLYIISDNNFTPGRDTLLYAFDLVEAKTAALQR